MSPRLLRLHCNTKKLFRQAIRKNIRLFFLKINKNRLNQTMFLEKKIILIPVKRYYNKTTEEFAGGNGVQGIVKYIEGKL